MGYAVVFASAFGAATILPFYSEVVVLAYQRSGLNVAALWVAATVGNTLGSLVNWWIGRSLLHFQKRRWFPVSAQALQRAQERFARWGQWSLLMAWLPVGGDALTFIGGLMRVPWLLFTVLVGVGKGARYAVLLWGATQVGI
nr:DedA family protein [Oceanococcus sp. HetDA_MAG_MS8]